MTFPVSPSIFSDNPYRAEWFEENYVFTPDGPTNSPTHHCKLTFDITKPFINKARTAVDVGCRMGEYTRFLSKNFDNVFAFDANLHPRFPWNVDLSNTTHFNCALGDAQGTIEMFGGTHQTVEGQMKEVPVFRLDDFGLEDVDYIKVDVEGFERKVLLGGQKTISAFRPLIVIEQNDVRLPDEEPYAAKTYLESIGYKHVATCPRGWDLVMMPE